MAADYILADGLTGSLTTTADDGTTSTISDTAKKDLKAKFDGYAEKVNKGTSFAEVYKDYNGSEPQTTVTTTEEGPNTIYSNTAAVFSAEDSDTTMYNMLRTKRDSDDFTYGKAYVLGGDSQGAYYMTIMYDISKDAYYLEQYRSTLLHALKDEEFDGFLAEEGKKLTVDVNESLVKYYKPTKIDLDQAAQ